MAGQGVPDWAAQFVLAVELVIAASIQARVPKPQQADCGALPSRQIRTPRRPLRPAIACARLENERLLERRMARDIDAKMPFVDGQGPAYRFNQLS
jgi:hypothetical protein